ncbi:MAG: PilZ domain-containing protein [Deltaproteobacteria bacterium]|nr:PilZ domain-containing protein [Deltaproteobacteria bacterium]
MELRQSPRVQVECPCTFSGASVGGEGIVVNLSLPGCAVESNTHVLPEMYLALQILMPVHFSSMAIHLAVVKWSEEPRFGVRFIHVGAEEQARIEALVKRHLRPQRPQTKSATAQLQFSPTLAVWPLRRGGTRPGLSSALTQGRPFDSRALYPSAHLGRRSDTSHSRRKDRGQPKSMGEDSQLHRNADRRQSRWLGL